MSAAFLEWLSSVLSGAGLIWILVSGVCMLVLVAESAALLTFWRRPSRLWRLGLVSLGAASLMFWVMSLAVYQLNPASLYVLNAARIINNCYLADYGPGLGFCTASAAEQRSFVVGFALSLLAVVGITCACVALALKLKGREPRPLLGNVWLALVRFVLASIGALISAIGIIVLGTGLLVLIIAWLYYSSHPDLGFAGVTYFIGFAGSIAGAVAAGVGALVLWLAGLRRRATMSTQAT